MRPSTRTILPLLRHYGCTSFFSTTAASRGRATYGFVGLGKMGRPMAANLRAKLPDGDVLYVYDINRAATEEFRDGFSGAASSGVVVADGVGQVVEHSVSCPLFCTHHTITGLYDEL